MCTTQTESSSCTECGTPNCVARFDSFLALEFGNPAYGAVHHLTVATYMLQHSSKLTKKGWLEMRALLRAFLLENKPPAWIRKENKDKVDSGKRAFTIQSKTGARVIEKSAWTKTICDVRAETPEVYCVDVEMWARAALEDALEITTETA
jgi:hypothetical protein